MTSVVRIPETEDYLSDLIDRAVGGEEILLSRDGRTVAKIVPVSATEAPFSRAEMIARLKALRDDIERRLDRPLRSKTFWSGAMKAGGDFLVDCSMTAPWLMAENEL